MEISSDTNQQFRSTNVKVAADLKFGWKCFFSEAFQAFNKPIVLLILFCISGAVQGMIFVGFLSTSITQIEKEFGLSSKQVGSFKIVSCSFSVITCIFIGYFSSSHKPRSFAVCLLIIAAGSMLFCLPKVIIGRYSPLMAKARFEYCNDTDETVITKKTSEAVTNNIYYVIFLIAMAFKGIGCVAFYTVGRSHIGDIFNRENGARYLGVYMAVNQLGMSVGYFVSGPLLDIWVDIVEPPDITKSNWIGAWWIGFVGGALLLVIVAILILGFPHEFPSAVHVSETKDKASDTVDNDETTCKPYRESFKSIFKDPVLLSVSLGSTLEQLVVFGYTLFLPKIHEIQFHFSPSKAALLSGSINLIGGISGTYLGGYIIKKFKLSCLKVIHFSFIISVLSVLASFFILTPCDTQQQRNIEQSSVITEEYNVSRCATNCSCGFPSHAICTTDNLIFKSPCHAGCSHASHIGKKFYNCTCFSPNVKFASEDLCLQKETCSLYPLFFAGMCLLYFLVFLNEVPSTVIILRTICITDHVVALGYQNLIINLLGLIPSTPMYGALMDNACVKWKSQGGLTKKYCSEYHKEMIQYYLLGAVVIFNILCSGCLYAAGWFFKRTQSKKIVLRIRGSINQAYIS